MSKNKNKNMKKKKEKETEEEEGEEEEKHSKQLTEAAFFPVSIRNTILFLDSRSSPKIPYMIIFLNPHLDA
jgi:hypothetical protein